MNPMISAVPPRATMAIANWVRVPSPVMKNPVPAARMPKIGIAVPIVQLSNMRDVTPAAWRAGSGSCSSARVTTGRVMRSASRNVSAAVVRPPPTTVIAIRAMRLGSITPLTTVNPTAATAHIVIWITVSRRGAPRVRRTSRGVGGRSSRSHCSYALRLIRPHTAPIWVATTA